MCIRRQHIDDEYSDTTNTWIFPQRVHWLVLYAHPWFAGNLRCVIVCRSRGIDRKRSTAIEHDAKLLWRLHVRLRRDSSIPIIYGIPF